MAAVLECDRVYNYSTGMWLYRSIYITASIQVSQQPINTPAIVLVPMYTDWWAHAYGLPDTPPTPALSILFDSPMKDV